MPHLREKTLSLLPCQDKGPGLPDLLNSKERAHISILYEISQFFKFWHHMKYNKEQTLWGLNKTLG